MKNELIKRPTSKLDLITGPSVNPQIKVTKLGPKSPQYQYNVALYFSGAKIRPGESTQSLRPLF